MKSKWFLLCSKNCECLFIVCLCIFFSSSFSVLPLFFPFFWECLSIVEHAIFHVLFACSQLFFIHSVTAFSLPSLSLSRPAFHKWHSLNKQQASFWSHFLVCVGSENSQILNSDMAQQSNKHSFSPYFGCFSGKKADKMLHSLSLSFLSFLRHFKSFNNECLIEKTF